MIWMKGESYTEDVLRPSLHSIATADSPGGSFLQVADEEAVPKEDSLPLPVQSIASSRTASTLTLIPARVISRTRAYIMVEVDPAESPFPLVAWCFMAGFMYVAILVGVRRLDSPSAETPSAIPRRSAGQLSTLAT